MVVHVLCEPHNFDFLTVVHPLEEHTLDVGSQLPLTVGFSFTNLSERTY